MAKRLFFQTTLVEAGCDEAGRGCLAGPVVAAAVILPKRFKKDLVDDSKILSAEEREEAEASGLDLAIPVPRSERPLILRNASKSTPRPRGTLRIVARSHHA